VVESETIEVVGRNRVIEDLLLAGLQVAVPLKAQEFDLIAYGELSERSTSFSGCPIQVKASQGRSFKLDQRFDRVANLIHAFVWGIGTGQVTTYALNQREVVEVAEALGYTLAQSWQKDLYASAPHAKTLVELIEPFRMSPEAWRKKVLLLTSPEASVLA
jgi:hypothetical protein